MTRKEIAEHSKKTAAKLARHGISRGLSPEQKRRALEAIRRARKVH